MFSPICGSWVLYTYKNMYKYDMRKVELCKGTNGSGENKGIREGNLLNTIHTCENMSLCNIINIMTICSESL